MMKQKILFLMLSNLRSSVDVYNLIDFLREANPADHIPVLIFPSISSTDHEDDDSRPPALHRKSGFRRDTISASASHDIANSSNDPRFL
jgi:hypothetical protein